ncbi:MAG: type I glutamate--ammonia ligase [Thermoprotei archaeon]|nr:MAG: type I glutamate--ammonia ligase [Thermoprotei archaeon]RLF20321.1 MAG: type I glutamate--ammonia ligase [Thermoprotei archaeon]
MSKREQDLEKILSGVKFVDLWFIDLMGSLRYVTINKESFIKDMEDGIITKLDGSSVPGFASIERSDMNLKPDIQSTIRIGDKAHIFCSVCKPSGEPHPVDPRYLAKRAEEVIKEKGLISYWGPEPEFFVFNDVKIKIIEPWFQYVKILSEEAPWSGSPYALHHKSAYCRTPPSDILFEYRNRLVELLEKYGVKAICHHHEVATAGQIEVNIEHNTLTRVCDAIIILKYIAKNLARKMGFYATFMPKPLYGDNGSGMHVHQSLFTLRGENIFHDPEDDYAMLSQIARYYIGGLIEHGRSLSAIVAPTVNSYKRLVPGYEAPVHLVWSKANRSAAIRIPAYNVEDASSKRIEYRPPDPSCNPYLALVAMLAAGIDGINKRIDPGDPVDANVYELGEGTDIRTLPRSLDEALDELECDMEYLLPFIPKETLEIYIELKRKEAKEVGLRVSPFEYLMYFNV